MSSSTLRSMGLLAPLVLAAHGAHADVTAHDVWSEWKAYLATTGYTVTATEVPSDHALTVSDIKMEIVTEDVDLSILLPEMNFSDNGDGTVNITYPAEMPIAFSVNPKDFNPVSATLLYTHDGKPVVVSGDSTDMTYAFDTEASELTLTDIVSVDKDDTPVDPDIATFSLSLDGFNGTAGFVIGDTRSYTQDIHVAALAYAIGLKNPDGPGSFDLAGTLQGLNMTSDATMPSTDNPLNMAAMLSAGMKAVLNASFTGSSSTFNFSENEERFSTQTSSQGGEVTYSIGDKGLSYTVTMREIAGMVQGSDIPFPLPIDLGELSTHFTLPLMKSDTEQEFALGVSLRDFALPDMLWGLFDPTGELPHDPATVAFDVTGTTTLLFDLMNEAQMATLGMTGELPGELNSVDINSLLVSAVGAELTGAGAFTFDNLNSTNTEAVPPPEGALDLKLVGANALIDKLTALGLVSEDDAMGARMMMGMFTVPADGEDTLTSKIEVKNDGQILANGQRLK